MSKQETATYIRAVDVFTEAANKTLADCKAVMAEGSANGSLRSGDTAKSAVAAFEQRSEEALKQILAELANRVEHRGRQWRRDMADVGRALEYHLELAPEICSKAFDAAALSQSGRDAAGKLIGWAGDRLRKELAAFRDGWTSPQSKPWRERHAAWYAIGLLILGAIVGQVFGVAAQQFQVRYLTPAAQTQAEVKHRRD